MWGCLSGAKKKKMLIWGRRNELYKGGFELERFEMLDWVRLELFG